MIEQRPSYFTHLGYSFFGLSAAIWIWSCYIYFIQTGPIYFGILAFIGTAYFIGSIAFGPISAKIFGLENLRNIGSGNTGATNVLRTGNKKAALLTLLGDMLKGTAAIILYYVLLPDQPKEIALLFGLFAFLGHIFPLWLGFKGGKGVATYLGVMFGLNPLWGLTSATLWILSAYLTKISSLGALMMACFMPILLFFIAPSPAYSMFLGFMSLILIIKHHENIQRICKGQESKISFLVKK